MKNLLFVILTVLSMTANAFDFPVRYVHDGDTIMITYTSFPPELQNMAIRLNGIDTPELKGKCEKEIQKAKEATAYLKKLVGNVPVISVTNLSWDKYGGRILGNVKVNDVDLSEQMIKAGFARPYHGEAKKSWCD